MKRFRRLFAALLAALAAVRATELDYLNLTLPALGDHTLHVLAPTVLEVKRLNSKPPGSAPVDSWNFVDASGVFHAPALSEFAVTVDGAYIHAASPLSALACHRFST